MLDDSPIAPARSMWKRFGLAALLIVAMTAATTATATLLKVADVAQKVFPRQSQIPCAFCTGDPGGAETIMVIGSDKRPKATAAQDRNSPPHSDTMMLVRMDPDTGQTSILSIPRDLKVTIDLPHRGPTTEKINAAFSVGGDRLALATVRRVLGVQINHIVDVNFAGFKRAVDAVGCVYVDVDRRYFVPQGAGYAAIDVQPGYQKLCDEQALDYVRFRHTDSDYVRVARQQDFVRQFKEQIGVRKLLDHADALETAAGESIHTDIHGTQGTLAILKLIAFSISRPVRQVHFRSIEGPSYVIATPVDIQRTVNDFISGTGSTDTLPVSRPPRAQRRPRRARRPRGGGSSGLARAAASVYDPLVSATVGMPFRVLAPRRVLDSGSVQTVRRYDVRDLHNGKRHVYRVVFSRGLIGEYWGFSGMDWTDPPLVAHARQVHLGARTYLEVLDGQHLKTIAWRKGNALYWVSNTLLDGLTNAQMVAIANSARPLS
jgi:LCP family protein required for cell wall assembly